MGRVHFIPSGSQQSPILTGAAGPELQLRRALWSLWSLSHAHALTHVQSLLVQAVGPLHVGVELHENMCVYSVILSGSWNWLFCTTLL